jgi:hypothetical protein
VARHLRVGPNDPQQLEQRRADAVEASAGLGGDGEGDERVGGQLLVDLELGLGVLELVGLVRHQERGQANTKRVVDGVDGLVGSPRGDDDGLLLAGDTRKEIDPLLPKASPRRRSAAFPPSRARCSPR